MIRHAAHERLPHKLFLFYANRRPEDAPFLKELNAIGKENVNFTFVPTMTAVRRFATTVDGRDRAHRPEMLTRHLSGPLGSSVAGPIYYVAGPPAMAKGLRAMLNDAGIDGDDIRTEEFGGY